MAEEAGLRVDGAGFEAAMDEAREKSRAAGKKAAVSGGGPQSCAAGARGRAGGVFSRFRDPVADARSCLCLVIVLYPGASRLNSMTRLGCPEPWLDNPARAGPASSAPT
jgi:hypothetical protein